MNIVWSFCNSRAWLRVNGHELVGQLVELVGQLGTPVSTCVGIYIYIFFVFIQNHSLGSKF